MDLSEEEELDYSDGELENSQDQHVVGLVKHGTKEGHVEIITPTDLINGSKVMDGSNNEMNSIFKETGATVVLEHEVTEDIALGVDQQNVAIVEADHVVPNNDPVPSPKESVISTATTLSDVTTLSEESTAITSCPTAQKNDSPASNDLSIEHSSRHEGKHVKVMRTPVQEEFTCYFCQKTFKTMVDLRYHIADHTKEKIYKCFCHKAFINREEATIHLNVHMAAIEGGLNFLQRKIQVELPLLLGSVAVKTEEGSSSSNSLCGKKDSGPGRFKCLDCNKSFRRKESFYLHKNCVQAGSREFKCLQCGLAFNDRSSLDGHKNTAHPNLWKFKCLECDKSYTRKADLLEHERSIHLGIKLECLECGKDFKDKSSLNRHKNAVHSQGRCKEGS